MDFGWDLGGAVRFANGELYARDFYTNVPPLSFWLLSGLVRVFGVNLLPISILVYLTWGVFLAGALRLALWFRSGSDGNLWCVLALATLSLPHLAPFHYYNTLSLALAVWSLCFLLEGGFSHRSAFFAGTLAALAALAKQPVGFMGTALGLGYLLLESPRRSRQLGLYCAGAVTITGLLLGVWGQWGQLGEFARVFFLDSASAKLTSSQVWLVALPRVTWPEPTHSFIARLLQSSLSGLGLLLAYFVWRRGARETTSPPQPSFVVLPLLGFTLFCYATPDFMLNVTEKGRNNLADSIFAVFDDFFIVFVFVSQCARFISTRAKKEGLLLALLVGFHFALRVAHVDYGRLIIPLFAPVVFRSVAALPAVAVLSIATLLFRFPYGGFGPMAPLDFPGTRGLLLSRNVARAWQAQLDCVSKRVKGRRTLFLTAGGPHPLYGALSVPAVVNFHKDQYNARIESTLFASWRRNPPELIVQGPFSRAAQASLFDSPEFTSWVAGHYEPGESCADLKVRLRL